MQWLEDSFEPALGEWLARHHYTGPLGVDVLFYRDREGELRVKPVVEINPRYTMGRVALELDRFRGRKGATVLTIQRAREQVPVRAVRLTPVTGETEMVAYWTVEE